MQTFLAATPSFSFGTVTLFLPAIATYSFPLIEKVKPSVKTVKVWTDEAAVALQDFFQCTDWHMYKEAATQQSLSVLRDIQKQWHIQCKCKRCK